MKIQVGKPLVNGRYVVFVRCASHQVKDWCEPEIATWHDGLWHHGKHVHGWIGPLPLAHWKALVNEANAAEQPPEPGSDEEFFSGHQWTPEQIARATAARQEWDL